VRSPYDDSGDTEYVSLADPFVQAEIEGMKGWWKVKVRARVKGGDVQELIRVIRDTEQGLSNHYNPSQ
jgi:hypothetical protein